MSEPKESVPWQSSQLEQLYPVSLIDVVIIVSLSLLGHFVSCFVIVQNK